MGHGSIGQELCTAFCEHQCQRSLTLEFSTVWVQKEHKVSDVSDLLNLLNKSSSQIRFTNWLFFMDHGSWLGWQ